METKQEFVDSAMSELETTFNANRPQNKRVRKKRDRDKVRKGLELGWEKRKAGKSQETIKTELKKELYGSIWLSLLSIFWANFGDDIIAWIIGKLFPTVNESSYPPSV